MTAYLVNVFDKETHCLVDTVVFLSWRKAQKYLEKKYCKMGGARLLCQRRWRTHLF